MLLFRSVTLVCKWFVKLTERWSMPYLYLVCNRNRELSNVKKSVNEVCKQSVFKSS